MPDYLRFATTNCLLTGVKGLRLSQLKYGFPPFAAFAGTYTVGPTGWSQTSYTAGQYAKRIEAGVVTGVYEAKGTFTASADPSTDTTNWRPHGITAGGTGNDFWYGCEPITKWTLKAWYHSGTGWKLPIGLGFPRSYFGSICRYGAAKRRMTSHNGLSVAVTDNTKWEDYTGGLDGDFDYAFSRYTVLKFSVGDIVARIVGTGNPVFYRCKAAADYTADSDGTGDPSTDTTHWEAYPGNRSLFLDFTQPALEFSDPFIHYTPTNRYQRWRETTTAYHDGSPLVTKTREFSRDLISGAISVVTDEYSAGDFVIPLPDPPAENNPSRPSLPDSSEEPVQSYYPDDSTGGLALASSLGISNNSDNHFFTPFSETHRVAANSSLTLPVAMFPNSAAVSFSAATKSIGLTTQDDGGTATKVITGGGDYDYHYEYTPPTQWDDELNVTSGTSVSRSLQLTGVTASESAIEFEYTANAQIPWYYDVELEYSCYYHYGTNGWFGDNEPNTRGWRAVVSLTDSTLVYLDSSFKVVQKIELLDEIADADAVDAAIDALGAISLPSGYTADAIEFDVHGAAVRSASVNFAFDQDFAYYRNTHGGQFQYVTTCMDPRLVENLMLIEKAVFWSEPAHWTVVQDVGGSPVETSYPYACSATSHTFAPSDATLATFQVALSDPSQ